MDVYKIDFQPIGRRGECADTETTLDCARRLGVGINNVCGGNGTCFACKIQIVTGTISTPTSAVLEAFSHEELDNGWRLACRVHMASDARVFIPPESMPTSQRLQVEGLEVEGLRGLGPP